MHDPQAYSKNNYTQHEDADKFIKLCRKIITWKDNENILDIGCADGSVTSEILSPILPKTFNELIGIDISKEMIEYAKARFSCKKILFVQVDIGSPLIPTSFHQYFHHIFSFNCLHWVIDQRQAFKNILTMLKPGGQLYVLLATSIPCFDVFFKILEKPKWKKYIDEENPKMLNFHYQHCRDPKQILHTLLEDLGYIDCKVEIIDKAWKEPNILHLKKTVCALNSFTASLPPNDLEMLLEEFIQEIRITPEAQVVFGENDIQIQRKYAMIFAKKPL